MGGSAFSDTHHTPRMPPAVYTHILSIVHAKLRSIYAHVATPVEAPAKSDYGDVDVLAYQLLPGWKEIIKKNPLTQAGLPVIQPMVASEEDKKDQEKAQEKASAPTEDEIAALLDAKAWKRDKGSEEIHFAIPWPIEFPREAENERIASKSSLQSQPESNMADPSAEAALSDLHGLTISRAQDAPHTAYVQLDLHICPTLQTYDWQLFRCAHGDFWTIVGSIIRRYGLSFRNDGLYLRIAEVEKVNRKGSLVMLTGNPREVLGLLFCDGGDDDEGDRVKERYWKRDTFEGVEDMCDFIRGKCNFYQPDREGHTAEMYGGSVAMAQPESTRISELQPQPKPRIQKKDRSRFSKRTNFRYWLEHYLPQHSPADREAGVTGRFAGMTRKEVAKMVVERFEVAEEFDSKTMVGLRMVGVEKLWGEFRVAVTGELIVKEGDKRVVESGKATCSGNGEGDKHSTTEATSEGGISHSGGANSSVAFKPKVGTSSNTDISTTLSPTLSAQCQSRAQPPIEPNSVLRTLRRRLSIEARDLSAEHLDDVQRAYRAGDFEQVKVWLGNNWREVVEKKRIGNAVKSAMHYREMLERKEQGEGGERGGRDGVGSSST